MNKWETLVKNLCYMPEKDATKMECVNDWNNWISVSSDGTHKRDFILQLTLIIVATFTSYFTKHEAEVTKIQLLPEPVFHDAHDFNHNFEFNFDENEKRIRGLEYIERSWDGFIFEHFPYFLIIVLFLALTNFNDSSFSDMIAVGYLVWAIYFVAHFRSLYTKNTKMIKPLRTYNFTVLSIYMLF